MRRQRHAAEGAESHGLVTGVEHEATGGTGWALPEREVAMAVGQAGYKIMDFTFRSMTNKHVGMQNMLDGVR